MSRLLKGGRRGAKLDRPAPEKGAARYFYILFTYFWRILGLNFLLIVFCLPVVTIPAAICAANRVCVLLVRDGYCFLWGDFLEEFRKSFLRGLPLGLLFGGGLALSYYLLSIGVSSIHSLAGMAFFAAGLFLAMASLLRASWTFVLVAMQPLNNRDILRNARYMTGLEIGRDIIFLLIYGGFLAFLLLLSPFSLIAALFMPGFIQYSICFTANTAVTKRIIKPFEEKREACS